MNLRGMWAIYTFEMSRTKRTITQSIVSPVLSTVLYFVVFGGAIGSRIESVDGISYGAFIVPGLIMLSVMTQSLSHASFRIFFPHTCTFYFRKTYKCQKPRFPTFFKKLKECIHTCTFYLRNTYL